MILQDLRLREPAGEQVRTSTEARSAMMQSEFSSLYFSGNENCSTSRSVIWSVPCSRLLIAHAGRANSERFSGKSPSAGPTAVKRPLSKEFVMKNKLI